MTTMNRLWKLLCAVLVLCGILCCVGAAGAEECDHAFSSNDVCTACGLTGGYCGASTNEGGEQSVTWTLADNHLVISGTGAMADFYYSDRTPWYNECETITDVTIGEGVTHIGKYAFHYFQSLTEITIPASVESIGYSAFGDGTVSSVTFAPNSRLTAIDGYAFRSLRSLKQITLPASVETIGDGVFESCVALETVTFEEGSRLSSLGNMLFFNCPSLTAISIPESVTAYKTIDGVLYSGDGTTLLLYPPCKTGESFTTPAGVTTIAELALNLAQFRTVILSEGVTTIGMNAFDGCSSMQSVSLPSTLTSIGNSAFTYCINLTTVTIPASVTSIGSNAFESCGNLTTVTIPASVTSIGSNAFGSCYDLTTVNAPCNWDGSLYTFADAVTVIVADHAFADGACTGCGAACEHPGYEDGFCTQCGVICAHTFEDGVCTTCGLTGGYCGASTNEGGEQSVTWTLADNHLVISGTGAMADSFYEDLPWWDAYQTITDVTIGEGVTHIGEHAFYNFRSLTEITIPASVESIGYEAFRNGTVSSVTFAPNSRLTTIDDYAFNYLVSLKQITLPASVESIGDGAFVSCGALETVTFAEGSRLSSLGYRPFSSCTSLTAISIPESVTAYKTIDGVLYSGDGTTLLLYPPCKTGESFTTPAGVTTIADSAFSNTQLHNITLSEGVTTIGNGAFNGCSSMQSVSLPSTLTSIGYSAFSYCMDLTTVTIPASVTSIGNSTFEGCSSLTTVTIPAGVTSIGDSAFAFCSNLTTVTIPASVTSIGSFAFTYCDDLTTVTIPASVSSIGEDAFYGCDALTTVNAPCSWDGGLYTFEDAVTVNVPDHAFVDGKCTACGAACEHPGYEDGFCTQCGAICPHTFVDGVCTTCGLTGGYCGASTNEGGEQSVTWTLADNHLVISGTGAMVDSFYEDLPWWDAYQTITDVTIGEGVTHIGMHAFYNFRSLTEITIPASVESIGHNAFGNSTVSSVTFAPNSRLTTIDDYAFSYLLSLKQITLPASVETIGDRVFEYCTALETVTFAEGSRLSSLGFTPFICCYSLTAISIPESVTVYKTIDGVLYSGDGTTLLFYPEGKTDEAFTTPAGVTTIADGALSSAQFRTVILSEGVTTIGHGAFSGCSSMQSVSLPSTLTSIGDFMFYYCDGLTTVTIPANVTSIGNSAFESCYSLTEVTIPASVTSIGGNAFAFCSNLTTVTIPASVTSIGDSAFSYCDALTTVNAPCNWDGSLYTFEDAVTVNVPDHAFVDGVCTACGVTGGYCGAAANAGGEQSVVWTYRDGVMTITGTGAMADYDSYDDSPGYTYRNSITALTIQEGVTTIGRNAFHQTAGLKSVTIPASVTKLGYCAFAGSGLEAVTFADESQLTTIDRYAFQLCDELTEITLPAGVGSFRPDLVFYGCSALTDIHVAEGNTTYKGIDGVLYTADGTTLMFYPEGKTETSFTTPAGVTTIGQAAFSYKDNIKSVTLSEGVTTIGKQAFLFCGALAEVTIPASVTSIGTDAFYGCDALTTVNAPCNWDGSLYTFADTVTVNVPEHTGGMANCQSGAICEACGEAYGELDYDVHAQTEVVWEWRPDDEYVYVYATLTCSDCDEELEVTSGEGEFLGETEGTDCKNPGSMSYSATLTFDDGETVTGTHTVIIPSENHVGPMSNGFCTACGSAEKPAVDPGEYEDETWDDTYLISNAGQLYWFANEVNSGNNGIGARLMANITVPASVSKGGSIPDWEPIGQGWTPYCGTFDGQGHTISGLYCVSNRAGLFGYTDYHYNIRNIGVVNGTFIGSDYAGALVGYASSNISSCWASGNTVTGDYAGGLVGNNYGTITASRATNNTVEGTLAGGLVGYNNYGTVSRSYATGNTVTGDSAGGLAGENYGTIENSYATGNTAGYLVGYNGDPITNCFTDGSALFRDSYGDVTNSYYVAASATDDGGRTSAQFASGEIAYLLQSAIEPEEVYDEETGEWVMADAPLIWGQSIGSASYPTLGGKQVYQVLSCNGESNAYSNTDKQQEHSFTDSVCDKCGITGGFCGAEGDGTNIAWTLEDGALTITGTGAMADYADFTARPWYDARTTITSLTISEGVTRIGGGAFSELSEIESVIIPATVKELGNCAFERCKALETVTFAEDSQLTTIGIRAFNNCRSLTEITLPEDVGAFDVDSVFGGCTALTNIFVAKNNETYKDIDGVLYTADGTTLMYYPEGKAAESFTTPDGVTTIADNAFNWNNYLKTVTVSEGVTSIGLGAFGYCGNLETVNLPDSLTSIGWYAFDYCYALTTVTIPDGVESIGDNAFQCCISLTTVTIPASVTSIGADAFSECTALTTVNVPCNWDGSLYTFEDTVTVNIAGHSYSDGVCTVCGCACPHDAGNGNACSICGATVARPMVTLPASLTAIDAEAFLGTAAEAVVIPANCMAIANGAFSGCSDLTVVIFAAADCTIADGAIPSGVAVIAPAGGTVETWTETNGLTFWAR